MTHMRFNPAPGWPAAPEGWLPGPDWVPDPSWPQAPEGWQLVVPAGSDAAPAGFMSKATEFVQGMRSADGRSVLTGNSIGAPHGMAEDQVLWEGSSQMLTGFGGGRYRLTRQHLFFESGIVRTDAQQIPVEQISDIDVSQTVIQKSRGVSNIAVHVVRGNGSLETVVLENIKDAKAVQLLLNEAVRARRLEAHRLTNPHLYFGMQPQVGVPPVQPAPHAAPLVGAVAPDDVYSQLEKLGKLRDAEVLTPEEFESKKAELLGRL